MEEFSSNNHNNFLKWAFAVIALGVIVFVTVQLLNKIESLEKKIETKNKQTEITKITEDKNTKDDSLKSLEEKFNEKINEITKQVDVVQEKASQNQSNINNQKLTDIISQILVTEKSLDEALPDLKRDVEQKIKELKEDGQIKNEKLNKILEILKNQIKLEKLDNDNKTKSEKVLGIIGAYNQIEDNFNNGEYEKSYYLLKELKLAMQSDGLDNILKNIDLLVMQKKELLYFLKESFIAENGQM